MAIAEIATAEIATAETATAETYLRSDKLTLRSDKLTKTPMAPSDTPRDPESMIGVPSPLLDIQSRTFATARRGYDRAEVDAFLKRLSETISGLLEERTVLSADAAAALDPEAIAESTAILEDAEARASRRLHAATLEADRLRTEARRTLDKAIKEAQEVENAARANAEQMTAEATEMRQQILRDLLRRRKEAQMHVEMLRAARDELMNVFDQVRRITAQVKDPLDSALDRAKQAADIAAKRTQEEPQESLTQFEAELQTARLSGVIPIPVEAAPEAAVAEAAVEGVALTDAGLADEAAASMEPSGSFAEDARHQPAASEPAISEPLASEPSVEPAPAAEAAEEPGAAVFAEPAERDDGWHDGEVQLEHDEPELESIFARLRESASRPEEQTAGEAESADEAEAELQSEPPKKSSKKKAASKKTAKKKASKKPARKTASEMRDDADSEAATSDAELASAADIPPADIPDVAPPVSEVQASEVQASYVQISDPPVPDAEIEDMKRRIKRALTTDESRVLQAVHRLHKKAPKKAEELKKALTDQDTRTEEFTQALPASAHDIQSLLVSPLAANLSACDIEEADTKALVQQVRDVYRAFSQERIAPVAAELAEHALEN